MTLDDSQLFRSINVQRRSISLTSTISLDEQAQSGSPWPDMTSAILRSAFWQFSACRRLPCTLCCCSLRIRTAGSCCMLLSLPSKYSSLSLNRLRVKSMRSCTSCCHSLPPFFSHSAELGRLSLSAAFLFDCFSFNLKTFFPIVGLLVTTRARYSPCLRPLGGAARSHFGAIASYVQYQVWQLIWSCYEGNV